MPVVILIVLFILITAISSFFPVWQDEHVFIRFGWEFNHLSQFDFQDIIDYSKQAYHPPLHLLFHVSLSWLLDWFGLASPYVLRLFSILASATSLSLIYRRTSGWSFILFFVPFIVTYYCFQIGPYPYILLFATLYLLQIEKLWTRPTSGAIALAILYATVLSYIHYFGTILVLVAGSHLILADWLSKRRQWDMLKVHLASFLLFLPWLSIISGRIIAYENYDAAQVHIIDGKDSLLDFLAVFQNGQLFAFVFFLLWTGWTILQAKKPGPKLIMCALIYLHSFLFVLMRSMLLSPVYADQLAIVFFPLYLILLHELLSESFQKKLFRALFILFFAYSSFDAHRFKDFKPRAHWVETTDTLKRHLAEDKNATRAKVFYFGTSDYDLGPYQIKQKKYRVTFKYDCNLMPSEELVSPGDYYIKSANFCQFKKNSAQFRGWTVLYVDAGNVVLRKLP